MSVAVRHLSIVDLMKIATGRWKLIAAIVLATTMIAIVRLATTQPYHVAEFVVQVARYPVPHSGESILDIRVSNEYVFDPGQLSQRISATFNSDFVEVDVTGDLLTIKVAGQTEKEVKKLSDNLISFIKNGEKRFVSHARSTLTALEAAVSELLTSEKGRSHDKRIVIADEALVDETGGPAIILVPADTELSGLRISHALLGVALKEINSASTTIIRGPSITSSAQGRMFRYLTLSLLAGLLLGICAVLILEVHSRRTEMPAPRGANSEES